VNWCVWRILHINLRPVSNLIGAEAGGERKQSGGEKRGEGRGMGSLLEIGEERGMRRKPDRPLQQDASDFVKQRERKEINFQRTSGIGPGMCGGVYS